MTFLNQVGEELQEEGDNQQADVHAIHVGIRSYDDLIISERVETVLNIEGCLQEIEFLVLIDHLLGKAKGVEGFSAE